MRAVVPSLFLVYLLAILPEAQSRPHIILEDVSYYSNASLQSGLVRDLVDEKNLEEVYQFYTYFEAIYDAKGRVKIFKEYKQGEVIHEERYLYDDESTTPSNKTVLIPGKEPEVTHPTKM